MNSRGMSQAPIEAAASPSRTLPLGSGFCGGVERGRMPMRGREAAEFAPTASPIVFFLAFAAGLK